jgi:hypothetical protein
MVVADDAFFYCVRKKMKLVVDGDVVQEKREISLCESEEEINSKLKSSTKSIKMKTYQRKVGAVKVDL